MRYRENQNLVRKDFVNDLVREALQKYAPDFPIGRNFTYTKVSRWVLLDGFQYACKLF
jgi:hypothetical protein